MHRILLLATEIETQPILQNLTDQMIQDDVTGWSLFITYIKALCLMLMLWVVAVLVLSIPLRIFLKIFHMDKDSKPFKIIQKGMQIVAAVAIIAFVVIKGNGSLDPFLLDNWHVETTTVDHFSHYTDPDSDAVTCYVYVAANPEQKIEISEAVNESLYQGAPVYVIVNNRTGHLYLCYSMEKYQYAGDRLQ